MYPNTEFLNSINMSKVEFERMCKMSSWATCSSGNRSAKAEGDEEDEHENVVDEDNNDQTS